MKFTNGAVGSLDGANKADIIVNGSPLNNCLSILGIGAIISGVILLAKGSFASGAYAQDRAEFEALKKIGAIK